VPDVGDHERLPRLGPDDLDEDQKRLYDAFVGGPRQSQAGFFPVADADGVLSGPYRAMLLGPAAGAPLERLGRAVRYEVGLPARARELAILTVAHLMESEVEWQAHERLALSVGVPEKTVRSLQAGTPVFGAEGSDGLVHRFVSQVLRDHRVDDDTFSAVEATFGRAGAFELLVTAGYYQIVAHINNAYDLRPAATSGPS
jgi:4-carboxymuconolactone decarboxylase